MTQPISNKPGPKHDAASLARDATRSADEAPRTAKFAPTDAARPADAGTKKSASGSKDAYASGASRGAPLSESAAAKVIYAQLNQGAESNDSQVKASIQDAFAQWASMQKPAAATYQKFSESFMAKLQQAGVSKEAAQTAIDDAAPSKGAQRDTPQEAEVAPISNETQAVKDALAAALIRQS